MSYLTEEYEKSFYVKLASNRVTSEWTYQYADFLDLCEHHGEENIYEVKGAPVGVSLAYELETLRQYIWMYGLKLEYNIDNETIALRYREPIEICSDVWTDSMWFDLNTQGVKEVCAAIVRWLVKEKANGLKNIPFRKVIFPTLRALLTTA